MVNCAGPMTTGIRNESHVLVVTERGYGKCVLVEDIRVQKRNSKGRILMKFKLPRPVPGAAGKQRRAVRGTPGVPDAVSSIRLCGVNDEVVISTSKGTVIRQRIRAIAVQSRQATGVLLQDIAEDDHILSVDVVPPAPTDSAVGGAVTKKFVEDKRTRAAKADKKGIAEAPVVDI